MLRVLRSPITWLLAAYFVISAVTLAVWDSRGVYTPTGDEAHYLVIGDALLNDSSTDVTQAYRREIDDPRWYSLGLAEPGSQLQPPAAHVVPTDDGFHSWHGLGVGALVAVPAETVGIVGARWMMVAIGALAVVLAWVMAGRFLPTIATRVGASIAVALAYPLLLASTQIYPDIPGGVLLLGVLTWWVVPVARLSWRWTALTAAGASLVPWLGGRFILPGVIAIVAMVWAQRGSRQQVLAVAVPSVISGGLLLAYHLTAFGNPLGPPTEGTLAFGREFLLLLPGLLIDQNHGIFWANPVLWIFVPALVLCWRIQRSATLLWAVLFLALWIPAAAHPGLYGLGSFNGRYAWPMALLAIFPALVGLGALARHYRRAFWAVGAAGVAFQSYLVALSVFIGGSSPGGTAGLDLYTRPPDTWLESYTAWWFPIQRLLPALYNPDWAFSYPVNWIWLILVIAVVMAAYWRLSRRRIVVAICVIALVLGFAAFIGKPGDRVLIQENDVTARVGRDSPGYPVVGPAQLMRFGTYIWSVGYAAERNVTVGKWELVRASDNVVVASGELRGTDGESAVEQIPITVRSLQPRDYFLRVGWYGEFDLNVGATGVRFG